MSKQILTQSPYSDDKSAQKHHMFWGAVYSELLEMIQYLHIWCALPGVLPRFFQRGEHPRPKVKEAIMELDMEAGEWLLPEK